MDKKCSNLFICYTPFHLFFANKLVEMKDIKDFVLVCYYQEDTKVMKDYFHDLASKAKYSFYLKKNNKIKSFLTQIIPVFFEVKKNVGRNAIVYSGNIKSIYTRLLIFIVKAKSICSFDDGMGNINKGGYFFQGRELSFFDKVLNSVGLSFSYAKIYSMIGKHYTIYDRMENAMPYKEFINIFSFQERNNDIQSKRPVVKVLLLTTFFEEDFMSEEKEINLYERCITEYNIDLVIPHPLGIKRKMEQFENILLRGDKIAEDLIISLKKEYEEVILYGFYSSALVNLRDVKDIICVNINLVGDKKIEQFNKLFFQINNIENSIIDLNSF